VCINFQADPEINTTAASFQIFYNSLFTTYTALDTTQSELFAASLNKESIHKISQVGGYYKTIKSYLLNCVAVNSTVAY
jgi:hypothetical protein